MDTNANLVVIELKRTEDGGHMELQAVRYAAMVSTMTFDRAVTVYASYLSNRGIEIDAEASLLEFLNWEDADEDAFAQDVRIMLVSADFSRELTTAVMWLAEREIDIRCIRLKPYDQNGQLFLDVQQIIPLPEVAEFQIQIREKERKERKGKAERYGLRKQFWTELLSHARTKTDLHSNISPGEYHWLGAGSGIRGLGFNYVLVQQRATVELYIDRGKNSEDANIAIFNRLREQNDAIESAFGGPLEWDQKDGRRACRIKHTIKSGGYRSDRTQWPQVIGEMVDGMITLEKALSPHLSGAVE